MLCRLSNMSDGANTPLHSPKTNVPQNKGKRRLPSQLSSPAALLPTSAALVQCQVLFTQPSRSRDKDTLPLCGRRQVTATARHSAPAGGMGTGLSLSFTGIYRAMRVTPKPQGTWGRRGDPGPSLPVPGAVGTDPAQLAPSPPM